jgi:hypothetical protein
VSEPTQLHLSERPEWFTYGYWPTWTWYAALRLAARVEWSEGYFQWVASVNNCGHHKEAPERFDFMTDAMDWCEAEVKAALKRRMERAKKRGAK